MGFSAPLLDLRGGHNHKVKLITNDQCFHQPYTYEIRLPWNPNLRVQRASRQNNMWRYIEGGSFWKLLKQRRAQKLLTLSYMPCPIYLFTRCSLVSYLTTKCKCFSDLRAALENQMNQFEGSFVGTCRKEGLVENQSEA